ncbi:Protein kinase domain-containing protein [Aphelenchoides fujianensis]|nr:Protein kinase domain-containing protein [Aphelenchoides fujianensis]
MGKQRGKKSGMRPLPRPLPPKKRATERKDVQEDVPDAVQDVQLAGNIADVQARLHRGSTVRTSDKQYKVERLVWRGVFGFTYEVKQKGGPRFFLRTEPMTADPRLADFKLLKYELLVLQRATVAERSVAGHFVRLADSGCTDEFKFVVTQALGENLHDITRRRLRAAFTPATALRVSLQMLRALQDLHGLGYLHRFVRPQAFAVGRDSQIRTVFLVDCGLPWLFRDRDSGGLKRPRRRVPMVGALRYVSRNVHAFREQARRDDLESWLFLSLEFFDLACLPWHDDQTTEKVLHKKKKLVEGAYPMVFAPSSLRYKAILDYVAKMRYNERPDYAHIHEALLEIRAELRLNFDLPYDWENMKPQVPKKKRATKTPTITSPLDKKKEKEQNSDLPIEPKATTPKKATPSTPSPITETEETTAGDSEEKPVVRAPKDEAPSSVSSPPAPSPAVREEPEKSEKPEEPKKRPDWRTDVRDEHSAVDRVIAVDMRGNGKNAAESNEKVGSSTRTDSDEMMFERP